MERTLKIEWRGARRWDVVLYKNARLRVAEGRSNPEDFYFVLKLRY
jgi:hypothetical protein